MWLNRITFFALLSIVSNATAADPDCVDWFRGSKLETGSKNCELNCATLMTDMGTFMCPNQCDELCKPKEKGSLLSKLVFYPGLTQAEKELVVKNPKQAYSVYKLKGRAEDATNRNFPNQDLNDESDAFRHFVWAGLLTKELGRQKAKEYLDAHETNPLQSNREKQMDIFNNERGQSAAEALLKNNKWNEKTLEAKAIEELQNKNLDVISPGLPIPKEAK
ncbi:MAG: hypothetical protein COT74_08590 [Bdellovibrionales bacterium CG10_big_fil_rev_8_21_14_0_10_45_34]|nr:MAG: hypothetical protein COT74_08590 [Bdellovibrionales bacterium CG10_big_fil_rev_8_21_14_0_10_45_34]